MESIGYSIASADALSSFIHSEIERPDNKVRNEKEANESKAAKAKAMSALRNTIALVDGTMAKLRATKNTSVAIRSKKISAQEALHAGPLHENKAYPATAKHKLRAAPVLRAGSSLPPNAQSLLTSMSADAKSGLGSQVQSLQDMATAIEPIVNNFDDVLSKPYLNNYSATINTVPVVGLKNNQIMYLASRVDILSGTGTTEAWTFFSALPSDANVTDTSNVHFFPYKGDFCLSVGTAVWRKRHRTAGDPVLQQAVDNWPKLYMDEWEKIGDEAFPAADLLDVVPFAVLSADRNEIAFNLLILTHDGTIQYLASDDILPTNTWTTMTYQPDRSNPQPQPQWARIAYWNNTVVAVDSQNNLWDITVDFSGNKYAVANKTPMDPTSEFTATDVGPVAVQSDGFLYKRFVANPSSDGSEPPLKWTKWVAQEGVTHLGCASPGVILDLQLLTRTLKSRYIDTQTALYPVVSRVKAFAVTHQSYLSLLAQAADDYANAPDDQKAAQAIKAGKGFVVHAQVWAKILNTSVLNTKDTVNIMTNQLHDVKTQLTIQLQILRDKLVGLQNTLKVEEDALKKLQAAFWGAVAAMFLGMALGVIALASGVGAWAVVGAGALFVAGLVAVIALGVEMGKLAAQVSDTQSQIDVTQTAIQELSSVVQDFTDLDSMYGTLNVFWGRVFNDANSLGVLDDATAMQLGEDLLIDTSSIVAAQQVTTEISNAAQLYLDTLNKQGIRVPTDGLLAASHVLHGSGPAALSSLTSNELRAVFEHAVHAAQASIMKGDLGAYEKHMDQAYASEIHQITLSGNEQAMSGLWYDLAALSNTAQVWNGISASPAVLKEAAGVPQLGAISASVTDVQNRLNAAAPVVVSMLNQTIATCVSVQDLLQEYRRLSDAGDAEGVARLRDGALKTAIGHITAAETSSASANNAFVDVNHTATEYQQGLEVNVNQLNDNVKSAQASADQQMRSISVPWYVYLGGAIAVTVYIEEKQRDIENDLQNQLSQLNASINSLKAMEQSGVEFNSRSLTWTNMVQTVSQCLGSVYNTLTAVYGQVLEDPSMYEILINTEWASIQSSSKTVLDILAAQGIDVQPPHTLRSGHHKRSSHPKRLQSRSLNAPDPEKDVLLNALSPSKGLSSSMGKQAKVAKQFFSQMQALQELPYLSSIIGYWDSEETTKTTLLDTVTQLRGKYVDMMSTEYSAIETLHVMSLLQEVRAQLVVDGKLRLETFVQSSLKSAQAGQKSAKATAAKFKDAAVEYQAVLRKIETNMDQIKAKISELDVKIEELDKKQRDQIIWLIADIIALSFATAIIFASIGVFGPVAVALTTAQALGLGATATAAGVKAVMDSLTLAEISQTIGQLQGTKRDLEQSLHALQVVEPLFTSVVDDVVYLEMATDEMVDSLASLANNLSVLKQLTVTPDDVTTIGDSWISVKEACTEWLDAVNSQGIVPALT